MARRENKKKRVEESQMIVAIIPLENASYTDRSAASEAQSKIAKLLQIVFP